MEANFYLAFKEYLAEILRESNHNLCLSLQERNTDKFNEKMLAISNVFFLYNVASNRASGNHQCSKIKVITHYSNSNLTVEEYFNLRNHLKFV